MENRLQLFKADYQSFEDEPMRSFHNGHVGDAHEQLFFIRNQNPSKYYTNVKVTPIFTGGYTDDGEFGSSGWGIKLMYGKRQPTNQEWDMIDSGASIFIPDIGTCEAADTFTNHPVWVRIYCPGGEDAQIRENMQLDITYYVREVGACPVEIDGTSFQPGVNPGPYAVYGTSTQHDTLGDVGYYYPIFLTESAARAADISQAIHMHTFEEYPNTLFYMPNSNQHHAMENAAGYLLYEQSSAVGNLNAGDD